MKCPDFAVWKSKMALDLKAQKRKGQTLLSLHRRGDTLVLLNVWDPIGARILEKFWLQITQPTHSPSWYSSQRE
jgi:hypothetical protein